MNSLNEGGGRTGSIAEQLRKAREDERLMVEHLQHARHKDFKGQERLHEIRRRIVELQTMAAGDKSRMQGSGSAVPAMLN